jgi:hypothetical protein
MVRKSGILISTATAAFVFSGCVSQLHRESITLSNGVTVDYVLGKVAGDGQESVFRDAWINGQPVVSHYSGGASLLGQALHGAVGSAAIGAGVYLAADALAPDKEILQQSIADAKLSAATEAPIVNPDESQPPITIINTANGGRGGNGGHGGNAKSSSRSSSSSKSTSRAYSKSSSSDSPKKSHKKY